MKKIGLRNFKIRNLKSQLQNQGGFTLIELAIVMVIIGIILGAVLKGQDLINNARAKKFVTSAKAWEMSVWTYFDRKGVFPGDDDKDGKIGDGDFKTSITDASFTNPPYEGGGTPVNTTTLGSYAYYFLFGTDGGNDAGKNVMNICVATDCNTAFTTDELLFIEAFDVAIDGVSDGTAGQVIGLSSAPGTITSGEWEAYHGSAPTGVAYAGNTTKTIVYYFDARP